MIETYPYTNIPVNMRLSKQEFFEMLIWLHHKTIGGVYTVENCIRPHYWPSDWTHTPMPALKGIKHIEKFAEKIFFPLLIEAGIVQYTRCTPLYVHPPTKCFDDNTFVWKRPPFIKPYQFSQFSNTGAQ